MRSALLGSITASILLSAGAGHAQECTDLARVIARESEKFGDQNQINILNTANLCSAQYESATSEQQAQIEAAFGLFSGGASGSSAQIHVMQQQRCENTYGSGWWSRVTSSEVNRVSQTGADVVRACLDQRTFRLTGLRIQEEALTATFRYGGVGETTINGVIVTPPDIAECAVLYHGTKQADLVHIPGNKLRSGDTLTLDCLRRPETVAGGAPTQHFKGGIVGVATVAETAQVPLITYSKPPLGEPAAEALSQRIQQLAQTVDQLSSRVDNLAAELSITKGVYQKMQSASGLEYARGTYANAETVDKPDGLNGTLSPGGPNDPTVDCPSGSFVAAMQGFVSGSGIQNIRYWCRNLVP